jgi:hypothetical protein
MLIEDDGKHGEVNPDALEEAILGDFLVEDEPVGEFKEPDEEEDELDIAFKDDDETW